MKYSERKQRHGLNSSHVENSEVKILNRCFEDQVEQTPHQIAVKDAAHQLTYKKLNEKANLLARELRDRGIGPDTTAALMVEPSIHSIVGIMAILKAGGAYLPIDPAHPEERIRYILADSGAKVLLSEHRGAAPISGFNKNIEVIDLIEIIGPIGPIGPIFKKSPTHLTHPTHLCCVIYTSGSTGTPKGVMVEHRNAANLVLGLKERVYRKYSGKLNIALVAPYIFDGSIKQIFGALLLGHTLHPVPGDTRVDGARLVEFYNKYKIDISDGTPAHLRLMTGVEPVPGVRHFLIGGEALSKLVVERFFDGFSDHRAPVITNVYGPTECCVDSTTFEISKENIKELTVIPIGTPMPNQQIYILGDPGELCIAGANVSRGYLNNPELTAEKFNRSYKSYRTYISYKTGDLARWLQDGNIEFLGRADRQVKVRGFRIELGEIENRLLRHPLVKEAAAAVRDDPYGEKYLCAYVVAGGMEPGTGELKRYLSVTLPGYMVPLFFVFLDQMPLTAGGKVDRQALPEPEPEVSAFYAAPVGAVEKALVKIWAKALGVPEEIIGINDHFLERGGHSLNAAVLISGIFEKFQVRFSLAKVFEYPTIREMSSTIEQLSGDKEERYTSIDRVGERPFYPLSSAQKRIYISSQLAPGSALYNIPILFHLEKAPDFTRLETAFKQLMSRHESFRTSFLFINDEPVQKIHKDVDFKMEYVDSLYSILQYIRSFDLSRAPLLRAVLLKTSEEEYSLLVDVHHIIFDGLSMEIFERELGALYAGETLVPLTLQYKDYAEWECSEQWQTQLKKQERYWLKEFSSEVPFIHLPLDYPRPPAQSFEGDTEVFDLSIPGTAALRQLAKEYHMTLYMMLVALYAIFLAKLTCQEEILVGTPVDGRKHLHPDLKPIIGMFVNTVVIHNFPCNGKSLQGFLKEVRGIVMEVLENRDYPFERLVEELRFQRDASGNALFNVMVAFRAGKSERTESHMKWKRVKYHTKTARCDLTLSASDREEKLFFELNYCTKLFKVETIRRFTRYFQELIRVVLENPGGNILLRDIEILPPGEREQLLYQFNDTAANYPADKTMHRLFQEQAAMVPDRVALAFNRSYRSNGAATQHLTYCQLNKKSLELAFVLREKGVKPDHIVGVMMERSIEMIIGIFGILNAGGAYLPIDPGYPAERIRYMLTDSGTGVLLSEGRGAAPISGFNKNIEVIDLTEIIGPIGPIGPMLKELPTHPAQLCYVIYTSGSTGRPKGVMVEHRSLVNLCWWHLHYYGVTGKDRATQYANSCFDVSIWEIFPYLLKGAALHIISRDMKPDIAALNRYFEVYCITIAFLPTPLCEQFMTLSNSSLRALLTGGDKLQQYVERNYEFYNNYGPTENTVVTTACRVEAHTHNIPIGRPIYNNRIYILNQESGRVQPVGVPGELCIAGDGLARGYLNKPELTAEQFNRSYKSYRTYILYKTGDLARWLSDGSIEFLGRIDHQVKIRGFRIESGEIENHLLKHKKVKNAVVTAHRAETADQYLCAYIVFHHDAGGNAGELKKYLSRVLPDYMIPAYFIRMNKIPLTPNGKVDRGALPATDTAAFEGIDGEYAYAAPRDEVEEKLLTIWSELLPVKSENISATADFFRIGGHSLKAMVMVSRIKHVFNVKLPLSTVFESPTIRVLAQAIEETNRSGGEEVPAVEEKEFYPLSSAQKRLFFLDRWENIGTSYNMTFGFEIKGTLDKERLKEAFLFLIKRHEALRTSFHLLDDEPVQKIHDHVDFHIESLTPRFLRAFSLSHAPLIRVGLGDVSPGESLLLMDMHHIIGDGTSISILFRELSRLYNSGDPVAEACRFHSLPIRYRDFAQWQSRLLESGEIKAQEDYWLTLYRGPGQLPRLELPTDFPRPGRLSFEGDYYRFVLTPGQSARFRDLSRKYDATLYMSLMTAFNVLLYKYTGQGDIIVGSGTMGRRHVHLGPMVGMFVNTLAMRYYSCGEMSFCTLLNQVKTYSIKAFENQDMPFEALVDRLNLHRSPSHNPFFDVIFILQNFQQPELTLENTLLEPYPLNKKTSKFDITLFAHEKTDHISFVLEYCTSLYKRETIERFSSHFLNIIRQVSQTPGILLNDIDVKSEEERRQLLEDFNGTNVDYPREKTIRQLFEDQVARKPGGIAVTGPSLVVFDTVSVTYRVLDEMSNRLANYLYGEKVTAPGQCIGILLESCVERVITLLGVLKSGSAYVPLEPQQPEERLKGFINDASIGSVISQKKYIRTLNRLQWECTSFHSFLCLDSSDVHAEEEVEKSALMDTKLWNYVGETAVDEVTGGGWISSYTGEPIPAEEMAEYGDNALQKLCPLLHPGMRVLEIGCASGITMYRIAPLVGFYYAIDLSPVIIEKNKQRIKEEKHRDIRLACMTAHEIDGLEEKNFELVIINSVIQGFHGHNYLRQVLKKAVDKIGSRGYLFIGDIMDQQLKGALIKEMESFNKNGKTKTDWSAELFVARDFFRDLSLDIPGIHSIEFSRKIYTIENELTTFRYDALLSIDKRKSKQEPKMVARHKYQQDVRVLERYDKRKPAVEVGARSPAYVIYTSGTTGKPKGVLVEHRSLVNFCRWQNNYYRVTEKDRATHYINFSFDASIIEIFPYFLKGAALYIIGAEIKLDLVELDHYFGKHHITAAALPTQVCEQFISMGLGTPRLRVLMTGGDKLRLYLNRDWEFYNHYGPTENTVVTTVYRVESQEDNIPIGKPIYNNRVYILNRENFHLQPIGIPGELCIAGDNLARGYLNKPELTAEKFNRSYKSYRTYILYRTGDLARWRPDGNIEYLGRIDQQVKISGCRIEPGEIESRLLKHGGVKETIVTARDDGGNKYLCAYVVAEDVEGAELKEYLLQYLPDYMIPAFFVMLDNIPLTPNGKVDINALPAPAPETNRTYIAPRDEVEEKLLEIWSRLLNITPGSIGLDDDFFKLGGHSLKVIAVIREVLRELKTKVQVAEVFAYPTIRALAACIKEKEAAVETPPVITIPGAEKREYYPLSSSQKQLYILYQTFPLDTTYNMTTRRIIQGILDRFKLETIFKSLIRRHESLRTSFHTVKGEPVQRIHKKVEFKIEYSIDHFVRSFDLSCAPLLRVGLVKMEENQHLLMVDMPHIISDGLSHQLMVKDFIALYRGEPLPELRLQYKDFSQWQNSEAVQQEIKIQEDYWLEQFKDAVPVLDIPTDFPRPKVRVPEGTSMTFEIEPGAAQKIRALAQQEGCTLFMLLLAVYNVLLYKLSSREDIVVGTVVAGRRHPDLESIMGVFVNTLALRNFPNAEKPFQQFLTEVKKHTLAAFDNQDYQFQELVRKVMKNRDSSRNPLFDVLFSFGTAERNNSENTSENREIPGRLYFKPYRSKRSQSLFDMSFSGFDNGAGFSFRIEYSTSLFKSRTIGRFANYFKEIVSATVESPDVLLKDITLSTHLSPAVTDAFQDDEEDFGF